MSRSESEKDENLPIEMRFARIQAELFKELQRAQKLFEAKGGRGRASAVIRMEFPHPSIREIFAFGSDGTWYTSHAEVDNTLEVIIHAYALIFDVEFQDIVLNYQNNQKNYEEATRESKQYLKENYHRLLTEIINGMKEALAKIRQEYA